MPSTPQRGGGDLGFQAAALRQQFPDRRRDFSGPVERSCRIGVPCIPPHREGTGLLRAAAPPAQPW
uniref:Uncharacterized protein n=1 Tax=Oryza nivara TaxID=4536 RepID=A0A0E0FNT8_ORYNI